MAILSHKWQMLWRKKYIFINISWHGGYGLLLSLFEDLETEDNLQIFSLKKSYWEEIGRCGGNISISHFALGLTHSALLAIQDLDFRIGAL